MISQYKMVPLCAVTFLHLITAATKLIHAHFFDDKINNTPNQHQ